MKRALPVPGRVADPFTPMWRVFAGVWAGVWGSAPLCSTLKRLTELVGSALGPAGSLFYHGRIFS